MCTISGQALFFQNDSQPMINGKDKKKKKKDITILSKLHVFDSHVFVSPFLQTLFQNAYSTNPKGINILFNFFIYLGLTVVLPL